MYKFVEFDAFWGEVLISMALMQKWVVSVYITDNYFADKAACDLFRNMYERRGSIKLLYSTGNNISGRFFYHFWKICLPQNFKSVRYS